MSQDSNAEFQRPVGEHSLDPQATSFILQEALALYPQSQDTAP